MSTRYITTLRVTAWIPVYDGHRRVAISEMNWKAILMYQRLCDEGSMVLLGAQGMWPMFRDSIRRTGRHRYQ